MPTAIKVKKGILTEIVTTALNNSTLKLYDSLLGYFMSQLGEGTDMLTISNAARKVIKEAVAHAVRNELMDREAKEEGIMYTLLQTANDKMLKPAAKVINPWLAENIIVKVQRHKILQRNPDLQNSILPPEKEWKAVLLIVLDPGIDLGLLKDAA